MDEINKEFWNKYATRKMNKLMCGIKYNNYSSNSPDENYFLEYMRKKVKKMDPCYYNTLMKVYKMVKKRESIVAIMLLFSILFPQYLPITTKMKKIILIGG